MENRALVDQQACADEPALRLDYHSAATEIKTGIIIAYAADMQMGIVRSSDCRRYVFCLTDWVSSGISPASNIEVVFELIEAIAGHIVDETHPPLLKRIRAKDSADELAVCAVG